MYKKMKWSDILTIISGKIKRELLPKMVNILFMEAEV